MQPACGVDPGDACGLQPHPPSGAAGVLLGAVVVQQRQVAQQIGRSCGAVAPQAGAADRHDALVEQLFDHEARILAETVADRAVDAVVGEGHEVHRGGDAHVDVRMQRLEALQPRHQPLRREGRRHGNGKHPGVVQRLETRERFVDLREGLAQARQQRLALVGQQQVPVGAPEQHVAQMVLQQLDLLADRGGGHEQLLGGAREAQMARGGDEGAQRVERRQASKGPVHRLSMG